MDTNGMRIVGQPLSREGELAMLVLAQDSGQADAPAPWDAMCNTVSLSELAQDELMGDPYGALDHEGFDCYTGCDTAMDPTHEVAMMLVGFGMMEQEE